MIMDSNILLGSNVYKVEKDTPIRDAEFVKQIQDYDVLKSLESYRGYDSSSVQFDSRQEEILKIGLRCKYAKNDPCWGYDAEKKRATCVCINGDCPEIYECNKDYAPQDADDWKMKKEDEILYGKPSKQRIQYFVDMVSDSEMGLYKIDQHNEGLEYSTKNPVRNDENEPETMVDPITGRKMVAVARKWQIIDNSDYQGEELVNIWKVVDDIPVRKERKFKKAAKIKKLEDLNTGKNIFESMHKGQVLKNLIDNNVKESYEKNVQDSISCEVSFMELIESYNNGDKWIIITVNSAERAYISSMLMKNEILHGFGMDDEVQLTTIEDFENDLEKTVIVTSALSKCGCKESTIKGWKALADIENIIKIDIPDREYYQFIYDDNNSRWTCRDLYGIKHLCIKDEDIEELDFGSDGLYPISIADNMVISEYGDAIGGVSEQFKRLIEALVESREIEAVPREIEGMFVNVKDGIHVVLGMGHMKFNEY